MGAGQGGDTTGDSKEPDETLDVVGDKGGEEGGLTAVGGELTG